uniref:Uncharacterized protein n=1 Tax=Oryza brachyantha TaxID=4533 RepID=J3LBX9_ORYBR
GGACDRGGERAARRRSRRSGRRGTRSRPSSPPKQRVSVGRCLTCFLVLSLPKAPKSEETACMVLSYIHLIVIFRNRRIHYSVYLSHHFGSCIQAL